MYLIAFIIKPEIACPVLTARIYLKGRKLQSENIQLVDTALAKPKIKYVNLPCKAIRITVTAKPVTPGMYPTTIGSKTRFTLDIPKASKNCILKEIIFLEKSKINWKTTLSTKFIIG